MAHTGSAKPDYSRLGDVEILIHARAGHIQAAGEFMSRFNQRLYRAAYAILVSGADAEDVLQDCYLKLFTSADRIPESQFLSTWLTRIVINASIDFRRKRNRRIALMEQDGVAMLRARDADSPAQASGPEAAIARQQVAERLQSAISELPVDFRTVLVLRDIEGLTIEQTANVLDIEPATVKSRQFRARRKLRNALQADWRDVLNGTFPFAGRRCEQLAARVAAKLEDRANGDEK